MKYEIRGRSVPRGSPVKDWPFTIREYCVSGDDVKLDSVDWLSTVIRSFAVGKRIGILRLLRDECLYRKV